MIEPNFGPRQFSQRVRTMKASAIWELLKLAETADIISFAGGLPATDTFPVELIQETSANLLRLSPNETLQYAPTDGYLPLRQWIATYHSNKARTEIDPGRVLITTGSQQALDLLGKVFIDTGSEVCVETPTYLGALHAFSMYQPNFVSLPCDMDGLIPEQIGESVLETARLLYVQPDFQNPSGWQMPLARREALADMARRSKAIIVEDSPYALLHYFEPSPRSVFSLAPGHVVYLGSFSKILAPGFRVGYLIAPPDVYEKLLQAKQAADLHSPNLTQRIIHQVLLTPGFQNHLDGVRTFYRQQAECMIGALKQFMPSGVKWNVPRGGMFVWLHLPDTMDSELLLNHAIASRVAFVHGSPFHASDVASIEGRQKLRLSFATVNHESIYLGIERLARSIRQMKVP